MISLESAATTKCLKDRCAAYLGVRRPKEIIALGRMILMITVMNGPTNLG